MFIQDRQSGIVIRTSHRCRDNSSLYILDILRLSSSAARVSFVSSSSPSSFTKWHHRLGHLCGSRLSTLIHQGYLGHTSVSPTFILRVVSLENRFCFPILLVSLTLLNPLILFTQMYGFPLLLLLKVAINIMLSLLMIILDILGFTL